MYHGLRSLNMHLFSSAFEHKRLDSDISSHLMEANTYMLSVPSGEGPRFHARQR